MQGVIPFIISDNYSRGCFNGTLKASVMFIDISGFSSMTQKLMKNGKEGAEVLADVINRIFSPAISTIYRNDGFVSTFAGDAFTSVFPSDSVSAAAALASADSLRLILGEEQVQETKFGSFNISVRISLSFGPVTWGIIPHEHRNVFHFGGGAIERCNELEIFTGAGEIVFDGEILEQIAGQEDVIYDEISRGLYSLRCAAPLQSCSEPEFPALANQEDFVPREVLALKRRGEFRDIVSCYVSFSSEDDRMEGLKELISLTHGFGGYFSKIEISSGEGTMLVLFGAPVNPGNLYSRALDFALAARKISQLKTRIGIASGTAFAGFVGSDLRSEYTALGSVVNLSARFAQSSETEFIYLDESVSSQCRTLYCIDELEPRILKGFQGTVPLFQLKGKKRDTRISSFRDRMVGRDWELVELTELLGPLKTGRFGGVAYLYGNPGIGKSRLAHEVTSRQRIRTLILQTDNILRKPLNPFTYFLRKYFEQHDELSIEERRENFNRIYRDLIGRIVSLSDTKLRLETIKELDRVKPALGSVLGISPESSLLDTFDPDDRAVLTRSAVSEFFKALSLTEPVIILVEDIQWLDEESLGVFQIMTRQVQRYPFIIMATARFKDDGSKPSLRLDDEVPRHEVVLKDLSDDYAKLLIEERLGKGADEELATYIQARTEGNPLNIQQFCLYLQENEILSFRDGKYRIEEKPVDIPADIRMILVARIDRLSGRLKETVQIASVLGREFEVQVLRELMNAIHVQKPLSTSKSKDRMMLDLIADIEDEGIWSALSDMKYIFNHSLMRDAVYDMQLRTRLRYLHRIAGDVIDRLHSDDMTFFADCAHHYEQAEEWDKAREFSKKAGKFFYNSLKYEEAISYHKKALSICLKTLGEMHPDTAQAYSDMGLVRSDKGDYDSALAYHEKSLSIRLELLGEKHPDTATSYSNIGEVLAEKGEYQNALASHEIALAIRRDILGETHPDTATSYNDIGAVYLDMNDPDTALEYYQKALAIEKETLSHDHTSTACSYNNIGHAYSMKRDYDKALSFYEMALAIQKDVFDGKHPHTATLYNNIASLYYRKKDCETALEYIEEAHTIQSELLGEKHPSTARTYNNIGVIYCRMGHFGVAQAYHEKALAIRKELLGERHPDTISSFRNIGMMLQKSGDSEDALHYCEKALKTAMDVFGDDCLETADYMGSLALVLTDLQRFDEAEELFVKANRIFADVLEEGHPRAIEELENMRSMYEKMGKVTEAQRIQSRLQEMEVSSAEP